MALTKRARAWLATLSHDPSLPTAVVERLILDAGSTPHALWLAFHDAYAGYIEEVGPGDIAMWGLARGATEQPAPYWNRPDAVDIIPAKRQFPEAIRCADANPVHEYELGADGWFSGIGGPCESFDMKIERHGIKQEFHARGQVKRTLLTHDSDRADHQKLLADMAAALVPEASGSHAKFFLEPRRLLQFNPHIKQLQLFELEP